MTTIGGPKMTSAGLIVMSVTDMMMLVANMMMSVTGWTSVMVVARLGDSTRG